MIHATCHTADNVVCLEFDATPWFGEAGTPSIIDLTQHGSTGPAIADSLERRRGYERLHDLIEYAAKRLQPESPEDLTWNTFECIVIDIRVGTILAVEDWRIRGLTLVRF